MPDDQSFARLAPGDSVAVLARYDFEGTSGPDPQGWTTADLQVPEVDYWHVDNFSGLLAPLAALEGQRSMWCGRRPAETDDPAWQDPGYGSNVDEWLISREFTSANGLQFQYSAWWLFEFDAGTAYDGAVLEVQLDGGPWTTAREFIDTGSETNTINLGAGTWRFRFRVYSDGGFDASDGFYPDSGMILDALRVRDGAGVILDEEFFEDESLGAVATLDGDWTQATHVPFGDFAGLVDGSALVQDDPLGPNLTGFWGFFEGSPDSFACGGRPDQPVVPLPLSEYPVESHDVLYNAIASPWIDLGRDEDGTALPTGIVRRVVVEFDVYREGDLDQVPFGLSTRTREDGVAETWYDIPVFYTTSNPTRRWDRVSLEAVPLNLTTADDLQVRLRVFDILPTLSPVPTPCHGISPLIDNVTVSVEIENAFVHVVDNTGDGTPNSLREAILAANATPEADLILFDLAGPGPHRIALSAGPLPALTAPVSIDASNLAQAGAPGVIVDGSGLGVVGADGFVIDAEATLQGLAIVGMDDRGVEVNHPASVIRDCWIGVEPDGTPNANGRGLHAASTAEGTLIESCFVGSNTGVGIFLAGPGNQVTGCTVGVAPGGQDRGNGDAGIVVDGGISGAVNRIGATTPEAANEIAFNAGDGVVVASPAVVRGNSIHDNVGLGIAAAPAAPAAPASLSALVEGGATRLAGTVQLGSAVATALLVDVYANFACDPSGGGEGRLWLESLGLVTDASGFVAFDGVLSSAPAPGTVLTLTTTRPSLSSSAFSDCVVVLNTPAGTEVEVTPVVEEGATSDAVLAAQVVFDEITAAGVTSVVEVESPGVAEPAGFQIGDPPTYLDISTTAVFADSIEVCLEYDEAALGIDENDLVLLHYVDDGVTAEWVDVTSLLDTANNRICGVVDSLSPFALVGAVVTAAPDAPLPSRWRLRAPRPNPFNPRTTIVLESAQPAAQVEVKVYDTAGRHVSTLHSGALGAGRHEFLFEGRDDDGRALASGVYFVHLVTGSERSTQRAVLVR